jgi:UDP-GlcNAc:undecaprenyl-phosphate/decaprenyl-phosphate GlcNAc-1-phosphate transferase
MHFPCRIHRTVGTLTYPPAVVAKPPRGMLQFGPLRFAYADPERNPGALNDAIAFLLCMLALVASLTLSLLLTQLLAQWAIRFGLRRGVVATVSERSSHATPTSRLGGVAVAAGSLSASCVLVGLLYVIPRSSLVWGANLELLGWLALGALAMFLVGLADDLWDLSPPLKLSGQILAALAIVPAGLHFMYLEIPPPPGFSTHVATVFAAVCWVVFFVNVFNFMDGSDGFAAGFTLNACAFIAGTVFIMAGVQGFVFFLRAEFLLILILGAATQGFYRENRPPARIFLGDSGSHFIGYALAVILLLGDGDRFAVWPQMDPDIRAVPAGTVALILLPFCFDVLVTLVRRARLGQNLLAPHREHLYQRLLRVGMSHAAVLRFNVPYFRACGVLGVLNAFIPPTSDKISPLLLAAGPFVIWMFAFAVMTHYWRAVVRLERSGPVSA